MVSIGSEFTTGQNCQQSGVYGYVAHANSHECHVSPAQREIPLSLGEKFPPVRACGHAARWRLVRYA